MTEKINKVYDVVGIGSPMIDFFVETSEMSFLDIKDINSPAHRFPSQNAKKKWLNLITKETKISPGGSVVNSLLGLSALQMKTALIGQLGNDEFAETFLKQISSFGVNTEEIRISTQQDSSTGLCFIFFSGESERIMSTFLGNSLEISLTPSMEEKIKGSKVAYIEGYMWNSSPGRELCEKIGRLCIENDVELAFNLSDSYTVRKNNKLLQAYIKKYVSILFGNIDEYTACYNSSNTIYTLERLSEEIPIICMTNDKKGSVIFSQGNHSIIPAYPVECLNSIGAGDLYVSGFLASYLKKETLNYAAKYANLIASNIIKACPSQKIASIKALPNIATSSLNRVN